MKRSEPSLMKLRNKKISHRTAGGGSEFKLSTQRVPERTLATTGRYVGYLFCTNYFRRSCMHGSPPVCTEYNLQTRQVSGPTIDVKITLRCTDSWSNVVESGTRCPVKPRRKTKNIFLTKKLKTNRKKNQTQTRTAMYLSKKDEEIDATDKEEEWIDFIKRSTEEAEEHMKKTQVTMLD